MASISTLHNLNDPGWGRGNQGSPAGNDAGNNAENGGGNAPPSADKPAGSPAGNNNPPNNPPNTAPTPDNRPPQNRPNPPGNRGQQAGPPDLEEVWRDFNGKISSLLGLGRKPNNRGNWPPPLPPGNGGPNGGNNNGGNGNNNGGGNDGPSPRAVRIGSGVILGAAAALWLATGFFIVQEGQVGVITQFGKYRSTTPAGFQWRLPYPFQAHELVNVSQLRTFEVGFRGNARAKVLPEALMLTDDENIIDMQFVVQYRLRGDGAPDYLFLTRDPDESVRQASETAMREVVGTKPMDFVLYEGRTEVAIEVQALMQEILDRYRTGIQISTVAIQNVQPPEQVQAAFDDAVKAGQDRERQINEGEAYANQVVPLAAGQASRMTQQAEGYRARVVGDATGDAARFDSVLSEYLKAPEVMRSRLYLETMQEIFSRASKVMIDTENGNNMIYLPIDKIMQSRDGNTARPASGLPGNPVSGNAGGAGAPRAGSASSGFGASPPVLTGSAGAVPGLLTRDRASR